MRRLPLLTLTRSARLICATAFLLTGAVSANATTIAEWTFETSYTSFDGGSSDPGITTASTPFLAAEIGSGTATGVHVDTVSGTTWVSRSGDGSAEALSGADWAQGDYFEFSFTSDSFSEIQMTWDQSSSVNGPGQFLLEWSSDNGTSWNTVTSYSVLVNGGSPNPAWNTSTQAMVSGSDPYELSFSFAAPAATPLLVKLQVADDTGAGGGSIDATGADRIDNVTMSGVPEPATWAGMLGGMAVLGIYRRRRRRMSV